MNRLRLASGDVIEIDQPLIEVTSLEPDPAWIYTDPAGHVHRWEKEERRKVVKTIRWVTTLPATEEYPESGYYVCTQCEGRVSPAYAYPPYAQYVKGLPSYSINGEPATLKEVENLLKGTKFEGFLRSHSGDTP